MRKCPTHQTPVPCGTCADLARVVDGQRRSVTDNKATYPLARVVQRANKK